MAYPLDIAEELRLLGEPELDDTCAYHSTWRRDCWPCLLRGWKWTSPAFERLKRIRPYLSGLPPVSRETESRRPVDVAPLRLMGLCLLCNADVGVIYRRRVGRHYEPDRCEACWYEAYPSVRKHGDGACLYNPVTGEIYEEIPLPHATHYSEKPLPLPALPKVERSWTVVDLSIEITDLLKSLRTSDPHAPSWVVPLVSHYEKEHGRILRHLEGDKKVIALRQLLDELHSDTPPEGPNNDRFAFPEEEHYIDEDDEKYLGHAGRLFVLPPD